MSEFNSHRESNIADSRWQLGKEQVPNMEDDGKALPEVAEGLDPQT